MPALTFGEDRSGLYEIRQGYDNVEEFSLDVPDDAGTPSGLVEFQEGEWVTRDPTLDRTAARVTATPPETAWPVVTGKERADYKGSGSVTVVMGVQYQAITSKFRLGGGLTVGDYTPGTKLTVKLDAGDGIGKLEPASGAEPVYAVCLSGVQLHLLAEDRPLITGTDPAAAPTDQLGNQPEQVIEIQVIR